MTQGTYAGSSAAEASAPRSSTPVVRIATFNTPPEELGEATRHIQQEVVPAITGAPGLLAAYWAVDPQTNKRLSILVWESEDAAQASMPAVGAEVGRRRREAGLTTPPRSPIGSESFEVLALVP